jgi:hypothetical protein
MHPPGAGTADYLARLYSRSAANSFSIEKACAAEAIWALTVHRSAAEISSSFSLPAAVSRGRGRAAAGPAVPLLSVLNSEKATGVAMPPSCDVRMCKHLSTCALPLDLLLLLLLAGAAAATGSPARGFAAAPPPHSLNLTTASIQIKTPPAATAASRLPVYAALLSDRVFERSRSRWNITGTPHRSGGTTIAASHGAVISLELAAGAAQPVDSYRIETVAAAPPALPFPTVRIIGGDERGVLFGVGRLLRLLNASFNEGYGSHDLDGPCSRVELPLSPSSGREGGDEPRCLNISSQPDFAMRGHQLGYR